MNITVKDLKEAIKDLPDDMDVIMPVINEDDANEILAFRHIRTIGILECKTENGPALCLNTSAAGADLYNQINSNKYRADNSVKCNKLLI